MDWAEYRRSWPPMAQTTQSVYDSLGRLYSVTNPSLSSTDSTNGPHQNTTTMHSAALRFKRKPDSSTLQWCYEGMVASAQTNCLANKSSNTIAKADAWVDYSDRKWHALAAHERRSGETDGGVRAQHQQDPCNRKPTTAITRSTI